MSIPLITDVPKLIKAVRAAAEETPDFVYKQTFGEAVCHYYPTIASPCGCIIGKAARDSEQSLDGVINAEGIEGLLPQEDDYSRATFWLVAVQRLQDGVAIAGSHTPGLPWGECIKEADKMTRKAAINNNFDFDVAL